MNKFMFAFVAFVVCTGSCVLGKPSAYAAPKAAPAAYVASAPASVSIQAIPLPAPAPLYSAPAIHAAPSYSAPVALLQPIAVQPSYGGYAAPAAPSILTAAASRPVAQSSASTAIAGLAPGHYSQLAIPSYEILAGDKLNLIGGNPHISAGYGAPAAAAY